MDLFSLLKHLIGEITEPVDITRFNMVKIAIDQSGSLGSFYDASRDTVMGKPGIDIKPQLTVLDEPAICNIYKGRAAETQNLLALVSIDSSLRVSILLQMVQPTGIASIIKYPLPIDTCTRFLYFFWQTSIESCRNDMIKMKKWHCCPTFEASVTHIISEIVWGVHAVVILQLPREQEAEIDHLLEQIRYSLIYNDYYNEMTPKEKTLLRQIISTTVYSNISDLTRLNRLEDVWEGILRIKRYKNEYRRVRYVLTPIQLFYSHYNEHSVTDNQIPSSYVEKFEFYLLQQVSEMQVLKFRLDDELPELLQGKLDEQLINFQQDFSKIKELYNDDIHGMRDLFPYIRQEYSMRTAINQLMYSETQKKMKASIQRLIISLDELTLKGNLIKQLQNGEIEYCNVVKLGIDQHCNEQLVKDILFKNSLNKAIFCSHDLLKEQSSEQWHNLYTQMIEKRKENPSLTLVYADFTYTTFYLGNMTILLSKDQTVNISELHTNVISSETKTKPPSPPPPPPPVLASSNEYINILLLGESGVGKSTFINAFANYLQFQTLQQAQSGQPIVLIPVSFLITINDNFDEQLVKFGDIDSNEDHNNSGQSVTQQCRSYVFNISNEQKLRIIDTPGFGDTRGNNQDVLNMEMIFSFVNNLTHLNSICVLLKPNSTRLNPLLFSCFTQLFNFFGENIRNNLLFCFTNARSTFFTPGDTRPLLKAFFDSFPIKNIPFEKKNTFCFDSESFRYLVALQEAIKFNEHDKDEFEKSWIRSVEESKRLRNSLCKDLPLYRKNIEWISIEEAQFQINSMIRPILEAIRNILRNILLFDINSSIKLKVTHVDQPTMICYKCEHIPKIYNQFWIFPDHTHTYPHMCASNEQNPTEYRLDYEYFNNLTTETKEELNQQRTILYKTCAEFSRFLLTTQAKQDDPFLSGLIRMLKEEEFICHQQDQCNFNKQLFIELQAHIKDYEQLLSTICLDNKDKILPKIYESIQLVNDIPMVKEQINAIKKYQQLLVASNERDINEEKKEHF